MKYLWLLVAAPLCAQTNLQITTTATQAVIQYSAPNVGVCTVMAWRDSTTLAQDITATGSQTFNVTSLPTQVFIGQTIWIGSPTINGEAVTITNFSITPTAFKLTANVTSTHVNGAAVYFLVHDTDPILFPGSTTDTRSGSVTSGTARTFVLGTRNVGMGTDNIRYSRALQANTTHNGSITCTSGPVFFSFTTVNPPLGETYPEPYLFDSTAPGNYNDPTINWSNQSVEYIDPLTGILIKRVTSPGDTQNQGAGGFSGYISADTNGRFALAVDYSGGAWTNPNNAIGAASQSTTASYSGPNNTNTLFLAYNLATWPGGGGYTLQGFQKLFPLIDNIQMAVFGTGSDANEQIRMCLSFYDSGNTCNTPWETPVGPNNGFLPTTPPSNAIASEVYPAGAGLGTTYPSLPFPDGGFFAGWTPTTGTGLTVPQRGDIGVQNGNYTASGATITATSGTFDIRWVPNAALIYLNGATGCPYGGGTVCVIASIQNAKTLTVTTSTNGASGAWESRASGVMIQKTSGTGTANISVSTTVAYDAGFIPPNDGNHYLCSYNYNVVTNAADGVTPITPVHGSFCIFSGGPVLHMFMQETGEARFIDPLYMDNTATYAGNNKDLVRGYMLLWNDGSFDNTNPLALNLWINLKNDGSVPSYYPPIYPASGCPGTQTSCPPFHGFAKTLYNYTPTAPCNFAAYPHSKWSSTLYLPGQDTTIYQNDNNAYPAAKNKMWATACMSYDLTNNKTSAGTTIEQQIIGSATALPYTDPYWTFTLLRGTSALSPQGIYPVRTAWNNRALIAAGGQDKGAWVGIWDIATARPLWTGTTFNSVWPFRWIGNHSNGQAYYKPWYVQIYNSQIGAPQSGTSSGFGTWDYMQGPSYFIPTAMMVGGSWSANTAFTAPTVTAGAITNYGSLTACPTGLATNLVQQGATGQNCIEVQVQQPCSMTPQWTNSGTTASFTATQAITTATQTSFTVSNTTNLVAGTTYIAAFLPIATTTASDASYLANLPGWEVMLVTAINGLTITVTRGVSGFAAPTLPSGQGFRVMTGTSQEAAEYPCDHGPTDINGHSMWSLWDTLKPLDEIQAWTDYRSGSGQLPRNRFMVVSSTLFSGSTATRNAVYDVVLSYTPVDSSNDAVNCHGADPRRGYAWNNLSIPGVQNYFTQSWPNGWAGGMAGACLGAAADASNPTLGYQYEFYGAGHSAFGFSGTGVGTGIIVSSISGPNPYQAIVHRAPVMSASNPFVATSATTPAFQIPSYVGFGGQGNGAPYTYQSYPNQSQIQTISSNPVWPDPNLDRWILDMHASLPSSGVSQGTQSPWTSNYNRGTVVGAAGCPAPGCATVWQFTPIAGVAIYKYIQPMGYAGRWLAKDISGPGSQINDSKPYSLCYAYNAGECIPTSSIGYVYVSFPYVGGVVNNSLLGNCQIGGTGANAGWNEQNPCVVQPLFHMNGAEQVAIDHTDTTGTAQRLITRLWQGLGQPVTYSNMEADPSGQWGFYNPVMANNVRSDVFAAKLPPFPASTTYTQGVTGGPAFTAPGWTPVNVNLPAVSNYTLARIRFGYAEDGAPAQLNCTARAEGCVAVQPSVNSPTPYYFATESYTWASCASGCTVTMTAIPGRVLYYVIDRQTAGGTIASSPVQVVANP